MARSKSWYKDITIKWLAENYSKREEMVPMRDGVHLYTAIYQPRDGDAHPILMTRTPFPLRPYGKGFPSSLRSYLGVYVRNRYILVFQNVRGSYMSEGYYVDLCPFKEDKQGSQTDEASDSYDSIEWLLDHTRNNGCVGVKGMSFPGFYTTMAGLSGHPALKAVSPQAPVTDWFMGDDAHIHGAYQNATHSFGSFFFQQHPGKPSIRTRPSAFKLPEDEDLYDYFLSFGSMSEQMAAFGLKMDFLGHMCSHPDHDEFWIDRCAASHFAGKKLPAFLVVAGWYDGEDLYGSLETYRQLRLQSPQTEVHFAGGPWYHGAWRHEGFDHIAQSWFGTGSARHFVEKIEYPFFASHLEGKDHVLPNVLWLPSSETIQEKMEGFSSDGMWQEDETWPPKAMQVRRLYLHGDLSASFSEPAREPAQLSYVSDPSHPVPYCSEKSSRWVSDAMASDQSFLSDRHDVLTFKGETLTKPLRLEGAVKAHLELELTSTDADVVVKLIDLRPDGCQMLLRFGVLPLRYRNGFTQGEAVTPGERMRVEFELSDLAHWLMPGHALMVQIQSSYFPYLAMNPQTFLPNQYLAKAPDYVKSELTIHLGGASWIELPVVDG